MTSLPRSERSRRSRVLMVGPLPEPVQQLMHRAASQSRGPLQVHNMFEALGEISRAGHNALIGSVIISDALLQVYGSAAIEAIRKLDPSLRIVLITTGDDITSHHGSALSSGAKHGVDACISAASHAELASELELELHLPTSSDKPDDLEEIAHLPQHPSSETPPAEEPPAATARMLSGAASESRSTAIEAHMAVDGTCSAHAGSLAHPVQSVRSIDVMATKPTIFKTPPPQPPPAPAAGPGSPPSTVPPPSSSSASAASASSESVQAHQMPLGDTDLVQAVLECDGRLCEIALELIRQQTKWNDVTFEPAGAASEMSGLDVNGQAVTVSHGRCCYGLLKSASAPRVHLQQWADWLGHWLALDRAFNDHRCCAMQDDLTGAGNRRFFHAFLQETINRASKARQPVTLMVFDIDNFKSYNDQFGHEAGDEILCETVRLMNSVIRQGDRVCRIGGDEFAVIFADEEGPREPGSKHPASVEEIARRFQDQICKMRFPKLGPEAPGTLSISAGLATYPWDGNDPATLLRHADQLALESKRKGKNAITLGPGARTVCSSLEQPKQK